LCGRRAPTAASPIATSKLNDDELGTLASMELNPQKARVLLMLGLTKTSDPKQLQQFFYEY
jgi:L-asparaginase/Glu-tRNA(Gln) amidotransferase subunit D